MENNYAKNSLGNVLAMHNQTYTNYCLFVKWASILLVLFFAAKTANAQTTLYTEDFSSYASGTKTSSQWSLITGNCSEYKKDKYVYVVSGKMEAMDTKCEIVWKSAGINIADYDTASISFTAEAHTKLGNGEYVKAYYVVDGGAEVPFTTNGYVKGKFGTVTVSTTGIKGTTLEIVLRIKAKGKKKYIRIDDVLVEGKNAIPTNFSLSATKPTCSNSTNGELSVTQIDTISGTKTYIWSTGATTSSISGLSSGTYTVTVTRNSIQTVLTKELYAMSALVATSTVVGSLSGVNEGSIDITAYNGATPYTYLWGGGSTSEDRSNLSAGTYNLTVTDNIGCTLVKTFEVPLIVPPCVCIASGNWTNPSIWSGTCSGGNGRYAGYLDDVEISGYEVVVDSTHTVHSLLLTEGGSKTKLTINGTNKLTVLEDFDIESFVNGGDIEVLLEGSSDVLVGRDFNITHTSDDNVKVKLNATTGDNAKLYVAGDMNLNTEEGAKKIEITAYEANDTIQVDGNLIIENNNSDEPDDLFVTIENGGKLIVAGNLQFKGVRDRNMQVELVGASTLKLGGSLLRQDSPSKYGKLVMSSTATLVLNGTESQLLDGNTGNTDHSNFTNIIVRNTGASSPQVQLTGDVTITNTLTMDDGDIATTADYTLILTNTSASALSGYSANSYIVGNFRQYIVKNTSTYAFPLGYGGPDEYYWAKIVNNNMEGITYLTATFGQLPEEERNAPIEVDDDGSIINYVYPSGIWTIEPDHQPTKGSYTIEVGIDNFQGLIDETYRIIKRPKNSGKQSWNNGNVPRGQLKQVDRIVSNGKTGVEGLTSFSDFGVGGEGGGSLPIDLVGFAGKVEGSKVRFDWTVSMEINNDFFSIERSLDGREWETIAIVDGAGNHSVETKYSAYDEHPEMGLAYYRLRQTDFDGFSRSFDMISIMMTNRADDVQTAFDIIPNPNEGDFVIHYTGELGAGSIMIYDMNGRLVYVENMDDINESTLSKLNMRDMLQTGTYLVRVDFATGKLVKQMLVK